MDHIWESCLQYLQTDDAKRQMKTNVLSPLGGILYNEFYLYVWMICFYHIFLIVLVFSIFMLVMRKWRYQHSIPFHSIA